MKKVNIAVSHPEKRQNGWYVKALFGPFASKQEADTFAARADFLEMSADAPPPTLGVNVSETIATKDKFG